MQYAGDGRPGRGYHRPMKNWQITLIVGAIVVGLGLFASSFVPGYAECRAYAGVFRCVQSVLGIGDNS